MVDQQAGGPYDPECCILHVRRDCASGFGQLAHTPVLTKADAPASLAENSNLPRCGFEH
jgi:hypothetical protein